MSQVFINYQRTDSAFAAHTLKYALLNARLQVFLDTGDIHPGASFGETIKAAIEASALMLALIGPTFDFGRLSRPGDWIAQEWGHARFCGCPVIPVLVDGAKAPTRAALPPGLRWLTGVHAYPLRRDDLSADVDRIVAEAPAKMARAHDHLARVLWIDDKPSNNEAERRMLREHKITFDNVVSTREALDQLRLGAYDLVLTDLGRTRSSDSSKTAGLELLDNEDFAKLRPPVIIYTSSRSAKKHGERLRDAGAFGVTANPKQLETLVLEALGRATVD